MDRHLISIVGPTGVGKTAYALHLAKRLDCAVVSADSVQIYQGLDIGSGKVTMAERQGIPHYLIDIVPPDGSLNAGEFALRLDELTDELFQQRRQVILVGGTGLYFQAIWEGFDEMPPVPEAVRGGLNAELAAAGLAPLLAELEAADPETWAAIDRQNPARVLRALEVWRATGIPISAYRTGAPKRRNPWKDIKIGLELPREVLYPRIELRVDQMLADGMLDETRRIAAEFGLDCNGLVSLGYRELVGYLRDEYDWEEAVRLIKRNTRRYAKRQFTWFRRYADIRWFGPQEFGQLDGFVDMELE